MKSLWKLAFNSKGFSLTEVMIGGGILAGVALAGAQLFKDQKFAQKRVELDQKLAIFHSQLIKLATDPANCNATIKYYYPTAPGTIPVRTITALYECVPGAGNKCNDDNTGVNNSFDAYTTGAYAASRTLAVYQDQNTGTRFPVTVNGFIDNTSTWQISSMQIMDARSNTGTSRLRVTYRMNPNHPKPREVSKDIFFNFRFSGGTFRECLNAQESNINNLQNDLCKSLNLGEISSAGHTMASWDDLTQTCVINGSRLCGDGQEAYFSEEGVIKCRKIIKGHEPPALQSPGSTPCASPYLQFEGGRVVVKC